MLNTDLISSDTLNAIEINIILTKWVAGNLTEDEVDLNNLATILVDVKGLSLPVFNLEQKFEEVKSKIYKSDSKV